MLNNLLRSFLFFADGFSVVLIVLITDQDMYNCYRKNTCSEVFTSFRRILCFLNGWCIAFYAICLKLMLYTCGHQLDRALCAYLASCCLSVQCFS